MYGAKGLYWQMSQQMRMHIFGFCNMAGPIGGQVQLHFLGFCRHITRSLFEVLILLMLTRESESNLASI